MIELNLAEWGSLSDILGKGNQYPSKKRRSSST